MLLASIVILIFDLVWFFIIWRRQGTGRIILTPFLIFAGFEIIAVWIATIYAAVAGYTLDAYPLLVVALSFLALLAGFSFSKRKNRLAMEYSDLPLRMEHNHSYYLVAVVCTAVVLFALGVYHPLYLRAGNHPHP